MLDQAFASRTAHSMNVLKAFDDDEYRRNVRLHFEAKYGPSDQVGLESELRKVTDQIARLNDSRWSLANEKSALSVKYGELLRFAEMDGAEPGPEGIRLEFQRENRGLTERLSDIEGRKTSLFITAAEIHEMIEEIKKCGRIEWTKETGEDPYQTMGKAAVETFRVAYRLIKTTSKISGADGDENQRAILRKIASIRGREYSATREHAKNHGWLDVDMRAAIEKRADKIDPRTLRMWLDKGDE